ncbi:energy transducer TonB [Undibacterium danionis]|uniref:Energy transducer TonB n=1 Tax=Undibacterium danionis TaxID=1812100 RepID=A0ABV6IHX4_9BURK
MATYNFAQAQLEYAQFGQSRFEQTPRKKMSSLLIAGALHAVALVFGLQASNVIDIRQPTIIDYVKVTPPLKIEEPLKLKEPPKTIPTIPVIQPPIIEIAKNDTPTITVKQDDKLEHRDFEPTKVTTGGSAKAEVATARAPVHIAAQVDSTACEKPEYPASSIRNAEEGTVNLAMLIGLDGRVLESKVEKSSGSRALDKAAIQGLSLCKFKPGSIDGVPEKSWAKLQYVWTLN